jgi:hypothetical protein
VAGGVAGAQPSARHRRTGDEPSRGTPEVPEPPASDRVDAFGEPPASARPVQELRPERRTTGGPGSLRRPPGGASRGGGRGSRPDRPDLPKRVRQANIAPQLREEREKPAEPAEPPVERSPEELRSMLSSIQRNTKRGRSESIVEFDEGS